MNPHYVYILKSREDGRLYIGCRTTPKGDPKTDTTYKSSCKTVSKAYRNNCIKRILKTFPTREEALVYEVYLHDRFNVDTNPRFFNKAKQTSSKFVLQGVTPPHTKTKEWSDKCKAYNASRVYTKKKHTQEAKDKIRATWIKKYAEGYVPTAKKKHSEESRKLMSEKRKLVSGFGAESHCFKPWFIQYPDDSIEYFYDKSKRDKSLEDGHPAYAYEQLCTRSKGVYRMTQGKFKGYIVGNIVNDIVCSA